MQLCDLEWLVGHVDAGDPRTAPGHRFSQDAAAATDIQDILAVQRCDAVDVVQP